MYGLICRVKAVSQDMDRMTFVNSTYLYPADDGHASILAELLQFSHSFYGIMVCECHGVQPVVSTKFEQVLRAEGTVRIKRVDV